MKKESIELTRHNVTPAAFLAYVRTMIRRNDFSGIDPCDIDLDYFRNGNDQNFDNNHRCNPNGPVMREKSVSRPYEMQTYILDWDGSVYNLICEFTFDSEKTGHGYFYYLSSWYEDTEKDAAAAAAAIEYNRGRAAAAAIDQVSDQIDPETETLILSHGYSETETLILIMDKKTGNITRGYDHGRAVYFVKYDYAAEKWIDVCLDPDGIRAGLDASCFDHDAWIQYAYTPAAGIGK